MNGRYERGTEVWVDHPIEGRVLVVHLAPLIWSSYPYTLFQPSAADSLPSLARKAYGRSQDYWFVASMNPQIECPDDVVPGDIIRIPTGKMW